MKGNFFSQKRSGFSLIEVVLAIALLGLTIVAVVGLLGTTSRAVTDVQDYSTAAQISEAVQDEFVRLGFTQLELIQLPIVLYGTRTGDRVVLRNRVVPGFPQYDVNERDAFPPRDWFYEIIVNRVGDPAAANNWETQIRYDPSFSSYLPLRVEMRWPHQIPSGPGPNDFTIYDENRKRRSTYHVTVPR